MQRKVQFIPLFKYKHTYMHTQADTGRHRHTRQTSAHPMTIGSNTHIIVTHMNITTPHHATIGAEALFSRKRRAGCTSVLCCSHCQRCRSCIRSVDIVSANRRRNPTVLNSTIQIRAFLRLRHLCHSGGGVEGGVASV